MSVFVFGPALLASAPTVTVWWKVGAVAINIVLLLGVAIYVRSITRRLNRRLDESVQEIAVDQPFVTLPDDGQTITVHANKSGVVFYILQFILLLGILTAGGAWMSIDPRYQTGAVLLAIVGLFLGVFPVLGIARLISKAPVLIVNAEGITDNATLIATGMGMIPWREVIGFSNNDPLQHVPFRVSWPTTLNVITERQVILQRQALWKRAILSFTATPLGPVCIPGFLLPMSVEELHSQIEEYARGHGHVPPLSRVPVGADTPTSAN